MKEAIKCAFPQLPNSGIFFVKSHGKFTWWDWAIGIVSTEAEMLFLKENPLLRLIQKGREGSNVSLWFCSALLHFVINSLVKRPSSDEVAQNCVSSHSLRKEVSVFLFEAYENMGSHHSLWELKCNNTQLMFELPLNHKRIATVPATFLLSSSQVF